MTLSTPILTRPGGTGPCPSSQEEEGSSERVIAVQSHTAPNSQQRMGLQVFRTPAQTSAHHPAPNASRKTGARVPLGVAGPLGLPQPTLKGLPLAWGWDSRHLRGPGHSPPAGSQLSLHLPVSTSQDTRGAQDTGLCRAGFPTGKTACWAGKAPASGVTAACSPGTFYTCPARGYHRGSQAQCGRQL